MGRIETFGTLTEHPRIGYGLLGWNLQSGCSSVDRVGLGATDAPVFRL